MNKRKWEEDSEEEAGKGVTETSPGKVLGFCSYNADVMKFLITLRVSRVSPPAITLFHPYSCLLLSSNTPYTLFIPMHAPHP